MFKKLLSNLPFNPSLINQVAFYSKRLKAESSVRRLGVAFLILALGVQIFAAAIPSEPSLAASNNDIIYGGRNTKVRMVQACDDNVQGFKGILAHFGVDCARLNAGTVTTVASNSNGGRLYSLGRSPTRFAGERSVFIGGTEYFMKPLDAWGTTTYQAIRGTRADGSAFWVLMDCANIVIVGAPTPPQPPPPPPPPVGVACANLLMSVRNGITVPVNTTIEVRGRATGRNLGANQKVTMRYEFIDKSTGRVLSTKEGKGIGFDGNVAQDPSWRPFKLTKAGTYEFTLAVHYDGGTKAATGNKTGDCIKRVTVKADTPPPPPPPCQPGDDDCTPPPPEEPECKDIDDDDQNVCITAHKKSTNKSQGGGEAHGSTVNPGDEITYTLSATNNSANKATVKDFVIQENIGDVLDYADVSNLHGGKIDDNKTVTWPAVDIKYGQTVEKQITVKVKSVIPSTPSPASNPGTFDCKMTNVYGDTVELHLPCSPEKVVEQITTTSLPNTGPGEVLAVAFVVTTIAGYFLARSRLMAKELDIVRTDYATSGGN